jgi:hypothetical protein
LNERADFKSGDQRRRVPAILSALRELDDIAGQNALHRYLRFGAKGYLSFSLVERLFVERMALLLSVSIIVYSTVTDFARLRG